MSSRKRIGLLVAVTVLGAAMGVPRAQAVETTWGRIKSMYGPGTPNGVPNDWDAAYLKSLEHRGVSLVRATPLREPKGAVLVLGRAADGDLVLEVVLAGGEIAWSETENLANPRTECVRSFAFCWTECDRRFAHEAYQVGNLYFPSFRNVGCRVDCELRLAKCVIREFVQDQIPG